MCFYYNLSKLAQRYRERATNNEILRKLDLVNGFQYPQMPAITSEKLQLMHWGLIPSWSKDDKIKQYTLNAKAETIFDKPSFKKPVETNRCIIPANGFFEWQHQGKKKQPFYIFMNTQDCFSFAGIYDKWQNSATGEEIYSYSIITTSANPLMDEIHNSKKRMPVILLQELELEWLNKNLTHEDMLRFFIPISEELLSAYPILPFDKNKNNQPNITLQMPDNNSLRLF